SALVGGIASVDGAGNISVTAGNLTDTITVTGTAIPLKFGMHTTTGLPSNQTVVGLDVPTFLKETIGGGAITGYDSSGAPGNAQLRWGKVDATKYGGGDKWKLFYQVESAAPGTH